ncbi:hypothetical protein GCM10007148_13450 [Parvularcula lutaonensis]|nr:hypothetical protein GCM10007148_13450 [Parvularcula lutaonensis]
MEAQSITEAVSLALAPIFLLAGIGALLNVMTQRLGRVVDRARYLEDVMERGEDAEPYRRHKEELAALGSRIRAANRAIYATSASALLVCLVVALLFFEQLTPFDVFVFALVAALFIGTMGLLTVGLAFFLREIAIAQRSLKVRTDLLR